MPSRSFVKNVGLLFSGSIAAQAILLLATPLLTRLYDRESFGAFGVLLAASGVASMIATLRLNLAIVSSQSDEDVDALLIITAWSVPLLSALASIAFLFLTMLQVIAFSGHLVAGAGGVFGISVTSSVFLVLRSLSLRQDRYRLISVLPVVQNVVRVGLSIAGGYLTLGWTGLLIGAFTGRVVSIAFLARQLRASIARAFSETSPAAMGSALRTNYRFPLYQLPSGLLDTVSLHLPLLVISGLYGEASAGDFTLVQSVLALPVSLLAQNVSSVFQRKLTHMLKESPQRILGAVRKLSAAMLLIGVLPTLVLRWGAEPLFAFVFGSEWTEAGHLASIMCWWMMANLVVGPIPLFAVTQTQHLKLIYNVVSMTGIVIPAILAHQGSWSLNGFVQCLVATQVGARGLHWALLIHVARVTGRAKGPPPASAADGRSGDRQTL